MAHNTQQSYKRYLNRYLDHVGLSAEELYEWQKRLLDDGDPRTNREVARSVAEFMRLMISKGSAPGTSVVVVNAVKSFMLANSLTFPIRKTDLPVVRTQGSNVVTLEQIREIYDSVPNRYKARNRALIMVLKDSGLRASDVSNISVENYLAAKLLETEKGSFRVLKPLSTQKTGEVAFVHLGPEAVKDVDNYLGGRVSGPLFLDRDGLAMSSNAVSMVIRRNVAWVDHIEKVSAHSFRKTHRTLLEARIPESYVKKLQGKSTDSYIHPEQTGELTKAYIENYDAIRVFREEQELEAVKQELNQYKTNTNSQQYEIDAMRAKLERMERALQAIYERTKPKP